MKQRLPHLLFFLIVVAGYLADLTRPLDYALMDARFKLLERPATGETVLVGIDNASLRELDVWPWPRRYHAEAMDRLIAAGARHVAFDIDFSSRSNPDDDRILRDAFARHPGQSTLPVFKQPVSQIGDTAEFAYTIPNEVFLPHIGVGHVNVSVERDSRVRRYQTGDWVEDLLVNGMAVTLSDRTFRDVESFYVDFSIRPDTIPYISYRDVLSGRFDAERVRGRNVIVGAVALELGDQVPVPLHRVVAGPAMQVLVAESIRQNRMLQLIAPGPVILLCLLIALFAGPAFERRGWRLGLSVFLAGSLALFGISLLVQQKWPVSLDIVPAMLLMLLSLSYSACKSIDALGVAFFRERQEVLHRRAMMNAVVETNFDGIAITDGDGLVEVANPAAARILGWDPDTIVGSPIHAHLPWCDEIELLYEGEAAARDGREPVTDVGPLELDMQSADGASMTLELVACLSQIKGSTQKRGADLPSKNVYIYTFRDVTDRKRLEEAQLAAREEAEAANRAKTQFLANMGHELRTPLNAIIGFSQMIEGEVLGPIGVPQYKEYITDVRDSGERLLTVINDVLDMSRIESGQLTLREDVIHLVEVVESCVQLMGDRVREGELELRSDLAEGLPPITADGRLLKQILLNLLSNAVKFTPAGGAVSIGVYLGDDGAVMLTVQDTGVGIPADAMDQIFQPFGQADGSLERSYEGTGLGLPLCKAMAELHGGTVHLQSTEGEGTTATLRLPKDRVLEVPAGSISTDPEMPPEAVLEEAPAPKVA